jgi:hypothetical protein
MADATKRMDKAIHDPKARFRQSTGEVDRDVVALGTGILFSGMSRKAYRLSFKSCHLKDSIPIFDEEGAPTSMFRTQRMPLWQAVERFGLNNLSDDSRRQYENQQVDEKLEFLQVVQEREKGGRAGALLAKNFPFEDLWIEVGQKHIVAEGGFHEFPFVVPRWDTSSGEDYGRSPGMVALPDVNTSQAMGETILVAGQRVADPPLMAPNDGILSEVNTFPGGLSYYDVDTARAVGGNPFFPLISGANLPLTRDMQTDTRNQIMAAFFRNILNLPVNGPQMTATEIIQRKDEFIREVGPVFGRFETDYNQPIAERVFNMMLRENAFLPIPEVLAGQNIKFKFELPVTRIRKQIEAAAARQWVLEMTELGQMYPEARRLVNIEAFGRFSAKALGIPHEIVNGEQEVQKMKQAEEAAAAQQQQMAEAQQMAAMAKDGSAAMKQMAESTAPEAEEPEGEEVAA